MDLKMIFMLSFAFLCIASSYGEDNADDEIKIEILLPPPDDCERKSKKHDQLSMHYTGKLTETGYIFDSSHNRNQPFEFQLGTGQVIQGWDEGLLDMCVGEKRKLTIPSKKGYGEQGAGDAIPPNAGLTFEVELLSIKEGAPPPNVFKIIDENGDKLLTQDEVSSYLKKQASKMGEEGMPQEEKHLELVTQIFTHEDKDKDGYISHEEFSGPKHDEL